MISLTDSCAAKTTNNPPIPPPVGNAGNFDKSNTKGQISKPPGILDQTYWTRILSFSSLHYDNYGDSFDPQNENTKSNKRLSMGGRVVSPTPPHKNGTGTRPLPLDLMQPTNDITNPSASAIRSPHTPGNRSISLNESSALFRNITASTNIDEFWKTATAIGDGDAVRASNGKATPASNRMSMEIRLDPRGSFVFSDNGALNEDFLANLSHNNTSPLDCATNTRPRVTQFCSQIGLKASMPLSTT